MSEKRRGRKFEHKGLVYSSQKHPVLEYIFNKKNPNREEGLTIPFTLADISEGYNACQIPEPASISNTILDLTRKKGTISSRLPESIRILGYDLSKRTGKDISGIKGSYAGEFVSVGVGNQLTSWLIWPDEITDIKLESFKIPSGVLELIRRDEGALFSIIDYTDALSIAVNGLPKTIYRVQNPMKWQPNEIDGFYVSSVSGENIVYPIEAKALTTKDDVNLVQMRGGIRTLCEKLEKLFPGKYTVTPIAVQGLSNGFRIGVFDSTSTELSKSEDYVPILSKAFRVTFDPMIANWK